MKDLDYYLNLPYKIEIEKIPKSDGDGYCATIPEFKNTALFWGDGDSEVEALQDLKSAFRSALIGLLQAGIKIPEPKNNKEKTKNLAITLKQSILEATDRYAKELGMSRSAFISNGIESYISSLNATQNR